MHLIYVDDSKDQKLACFSALSISEDNWQGALAHLNEMRRQLRESDGLFTRKELHATEFVAGRGRIAQNVIPKARRVALFDFVLTSVRMLPGAQLFNAAVPKNDEERAFEYLLNRIEVNMSKSGSRAMIISDEGKSYDAMLRRMRHFNFIPSKHGHWHEHGSARNIPIERIIEDIVYRDSKRSLFIQVVDFCAFALLRRESQIASRNKYGLHLSFDILEPIIVKRANSRDPLGIIR